MKRALLLAALLCACAHAPRQLVAVRAHAATGSVQASTPAIAPGPPPAPLVIVRLVRLARRCTIPPAPEMPDTDALLASSVGLADRVDRLRAGRDERIAYERRLLAALKSCR